MDQTSLAFSIAQTVFAALQCSQLKQLVSMFSYQSEFLRLEETVKFIESVLRDADTKRELNEQEQHFVQRLSNAIYDADDLVDELNTVAAQEMMQHPLTDQESAGWFSKVHNLFSRLNGWSFAYDMSREVKQLRETLDGIASDASKFCFKVDNQPIRRRRDETCSYVYQPDIIGRKEDKDRVVEMLLDPNVEGHIPVLSIVGMGGLGKTALAQLVFEDDSIKLEFPLRLWACVSDEGQRVFNVDSVLGSILKSNSDETHIDGLVRQQLQRKLREKLEGNKYLLVLDDVWTEEHGEWLKLVGFLKGGQRGSRIVVTTRSKGTAIAVGSGPFTYELQGLLDDDSWLLFEMTVGQAQANQPDLVDIGREIVKKCGNVPLAIKVIGSLLHEQKKDKWKCYEKNELSEIKKGENDIMHILKFSYHHLSPSLKSCFTYCALFPKDFIIKKEMLISLWLAQGYINEPLDRGQSIEDKAEEQFLILLRRCFFQDVKKDEYGEIVSFKIHDLMHDVAQEVRRKDICGSVTNLTAMSNQGETIRHISHASSIGSGSYFTMTKVRTRLLHRCINVASHRFLVDALLANLTCLRALDLSHLKIRSLSDAIGGLLHLRYLDLSWTLLEVLPKSITKLHNLQTLLLRFCFELRELPKDCCKLVHLRVLDTTNCSRLAYMPSGMQKLTDLCKLPTFIVCGRSSSSKQGVRELEDLGALKKLKGRLKIQISKDYRYVKEKQGKGAGYLRDKEHLNEVYIGWEKDREENYEGRVGEHEALLEDLQPHRNLKDLSIQYYEGERLPRWGRDAKFARCLPILVKIRLWCCEELQELPWLSKLCCLKSLYIYKVKKLEYMENNKNTSSSSSNSYEGGAEVRERESSSSSSSSLIFFPSLEKLELKDLPKLKGWWVGCGSGVLPLPEFPRLSKLRIWDCQELASIPPCPNLETLELLGCPELTSIPPCPNLETVQLGYGVNERLRINEGGNQSHGFKLKSVMILINVGSLKCLPIQALYCLTELVIRGDKEVESMSGIGVIEEVFRTCSSSLRSLEICNFSKLRRVSGGGGGGGGGGGLEHLTALERLNLENLDELRLNEDEEDDDMPWISLGQSLRSLTLFEMPKIVKLPKGMHHLTSLQTLKIEGCPLEEVPEWIGDGCFSSLQSLTISRTKIELLPDAMRNLTSLTTLDIRRCTSALTERCRAQNPPGEDWPKIQNIRHILVDSNKQVKHHHQTNSDVASC